MSLIIIILNLTIWCVSVSCVCIHKLYIYVCCIYRTLVHIFISCCWVLCAFELHKIIYIQWIHLRHRCYATLLRTIYHLNTRTVDKLCAGDVVVAAAVAVAAVVRESMPMRSTQAMVRFLDLA